MTEQDVLKRIKIACGGNLTQWAKSIDVSKAYVSAVLLGKTPPGEAVLKPLGLERVITYRKKGK